MNHFPRAVQTLSISDVTGSDDIDTARVLYVIDILKDKIQELVSLSNACLNVFDKTLRPACEATEDKEVEEAYWDFLEPFSKLSMAIMGHQVAKHDIEHPDKQIDLEKVYNRAMEETNKMFANYATTGRLSKLS